MTLPFDIVKKKYSRNCEIYLNTDKDKMDFV
jgi:hypothetical protein